MTRTSHQESRRQTSAYLGVDVSKRHLDYSFSETGGEGRVENTAEGIGELIGLCEGHPAIRVVCEATGGYEQTLLKALVKEGIRASLVSPCKVRHFAMAEGLMAKTDRIDARLLCRFAGAMEASLRDYVDVGPQAARLRELVQYRHHLVVRQSELASLRENASETLLELLAREAAQIRELLGEVECQLREIESQDKALCAKMERMQQIKGIGPVVARTVCALMPEIGQIDDKTAAALIGTAPHPNQSGPVEKRRFTRGGRKPVRDALYMAAVSAIRCNPILKTFYLRLKQSGKHGTLCLVAVIRKLICLINRICSDPNFKIS